MSALPSSSPTTVLPRWKPWLFWGLAALFYCYGFFQRVAPSVMIDDLMRDFAVSAALLGNLSAFYFYAYAGLQLPVGIAVDRFGPRRVLAASAVACGAGSLLFGLATQLEVAYLGRLLIGAGAAFTWVGALKVATIWFPPRRFALISGLTLMLGMAGAIGGQGPLAALVDWAGWRATLTGAAGFALLLALTLWVVLRDHPDHQTPHAHAPLAPASPTKKAGIFDGLAGVMRNGQTWWVSLFGAMMTAPMLAFGGLWGVPFMMRAYDLDRPQAALAVSLLMLGWGMGAPFAGWLSDRIGRRRPSMIASAVLAMLTMGGLLYLPNLPLAGAYTLLVLNGFVSGGMVICFAAVREHNRVKDSGVTLGFANMAVMSTGAVFQPLIGALLDMNWSGVMDGGTRFYALGDFKMSLLVLPVCGVVALVAAAMSRETYCKSIHAD